MGLFSSSKTNVNSNVNVAVESNPVVNVDVAPLISANERFSANTQELIAGILGGFKSDAAASNRQNQNTLSTLSTFAQGASGGLTDIQRQISGIGGGIQSGGQTVAGGVRDFGNSVAFAVLGTGALIALALV